ncbi:MAG TPA: magnesium-translocating P-type ATPase, partial [Gemmataceae bacterium]|nr:magnesium-translocating P-type ATPase [Gemmataceae bacterium]
SAALGDPTGAGIVIAIVFAGSVINLVQTWRSSTAVRRLRESVAPTATVLRDGTWQEQPRDQVVPGDVVRLSAGDLVPADARLLDTRELHVQQAALTGESLPVEKSASSTPTGGSLRPDDPDAVFLGTSVVSGTATAVVVATGPATTFGELVARLGDRPPETEFDRGARRFGLFITQTVFVLVIAVFLVSAVQRRDPIQSLLFAVALAVGLTPEFLPLISAVTLARGAVRMARRQVVVKHLAAIQNLGSMDVLCSDKTGTLTTGEMTLARTTDPYGATSERAASLAVVNSQFETGIKSPLDAAILRARPAADGYRKVDEVPFDFERRRLTIVADGPEGRQLITKGAPESVLACCSHLEVGGAVTPLDPAAHGRVVATCQQLGGQGLRLLAVAHRAVPHEPAYRAADEAGLTLAGLLAFADPPRPDCAGAVRALAHDGVRVVVLTGDNERVAGHVCAQVGLPADRIVLGVDLDAMSDAALGHAAETAAVFARVSPAQKTRVIRALKARGHVVGYLGDGVNDAPSLHAADVGISVAGAVDVAKDAAEVVLIRPGLRVLHDGIIEGRRAFGNVMKYLLMETSSNFGNMLSMAAATAVLPFLPMLPTQVLLNGLLYNLTQLAIPTDRVEPGYLHKPRRWDIGVIRRFMFVLGPVSSVFDFLTFWALLVLFRADEATFHTGWFVESLATQTLVLFVIRTAGNPLRARPSRALTWAILGVLAVAVALPYSPLAGPLGFVPLPAAYLALVVVGSAAYLGLAELAKRLLLRRAFR